MTPRTETVPFTREQIEAIVRNAVAAFYRSFQRRPTEREQALLSSALTRHILAPNAPSDRVH